MEGKLLGLFAIVPVTLILTVSFFVLLVLRKLESSILKVFGLCVAALLWLSALLVFSGGIYTLATGKCPMQQMMMQKHKMMMRDMMGDKMMDKMMDKKMNMDREKMPEMKH